MLQDFSRIWKSLISTHDRGIHIYDERRKDFLFTSYADFSEQALQISTFLREEGISPGSRVLLSAKTCHEFPALWLALVLTGTTPVPMPPREAMLGETTYANWLANIVPHFSVCLCHEEEIGEVSGCISKSGALHILEITDLMKKIKDIRNSARICFPNRTDTAFIQFTSGSTSRPKGIMISYDNLYSNISAIWSRLGVRPEAESFISWAPLHHDMGLVANFLGCLFTQTRLILMPSHYFAKRPIKFLELISEHKANYCTMPNFALEWILKRFNTIPKPDLRLESIKWLGIGAEPIHIAKFKEFAKTFAPFGLIQEALSPAYGLAEATLAVTVNAPEECFETIIHDDQEVILAGTPVNGIDIFIDSLPNNPNIGKIKVRGASIARYALIEGQVKEITDYDGYYDTGDIGFFEGQNLVVLGRSDEMFIINGQNYFPYDIEAKVRQLTGVIRNRVACFATKHSSNETTTPKVVVILESKNNGNNEELSHYVRDEVFRLFGIWIDEVLCLQPKTIPVTPSGKIQRTKAAEQYLANKFGDNSYN